MSALIWNVNATVQNHYAISSFVQYMDRTTRNHGHIDSMCGYNNLEPLGHWLNTWIQPLGIIRPPKSIQL